MNEFQLAMEERKKNGWRTLREIWGEHERHVKVFSNGGTDFTLMGVSPKGDAALYDETYGMLQTRSADNYFWSCPEVTMKPGELQ